MHVAQLVLIAVYVILPPGLMALALASRAPRRVSRVASVLFTWIWGAVVGAMIAFSAGRLLGGQVPVTEYLRLVYFVMAVACMFKVIDRLLLRLVFWVARVKLDGRNRPPQPHSLLGAAALILQRLAMLLIVIAGVFGLLLTYRPHLRRPGSPADLKLSFSTVDFRTSDNIRLSGWWIPAAALPTTREADSAEPWGKHTAILCHGLYGGKEQCLPLASLLCKNGVNVLAFDFRAHGASSGHFSSLGDRERWDVLAAVQWLKEQHADESQRIVAVGSNTGAAAVLAAAGHEGLGRSIDALVLYEPYSDLNSLTVATAQSLPASIAWLAGRLALPVASVHAGSDLSAFSPIQTADRIWPRPVLLIHGRGQSFVPVTQEMDLYQMLSTPKQQFWPAENLSRMHRRLGKLDSPTSMVLDLFQQWLGLQDAVSNDPAVQEHTMEFIRQAKEEPVL